MTALLIIIYLAFISLGLPDSLVGTSWPVMQMDMSASLGTVGIISMIVSGGTVVSSIFSYRLIAKFKTPKVTIISVFMTATALFGYSNSSSIVGLFIFAIPLGLGAGSVDAALNNFVAIHYKSRHMSWLHCFWGIGATGGPMIMSLFILEKNGWGKGFLIISLIQIVLAVVLIGTLPLWKKANETGEESGEEEIKTLSNREGLKVSGVKLALVSFVFFAATELSTGLWSSSFLVGIKRIEPDVAARWVSYFYGGITVGRFISGFLTMKIKSLVLIRIGQIICIIGSIILMLPLHDYFSMVGLIFMGLGTSPIFPCMLHETPNRFGKQFSGVIMGLQMAVAYIGSTFMPPLLGAVATKTSISIFPYFLFMFTTIMLVASECLNIKLKGIKIKD